MLWSLAAAAIAAEPIWPDFAAPEPPPVRYDESPFAAPPVPHWDIALPGGRLNVFTHTEHTRPVVSGDNLYVGSAAGAAVYVIARRTGVLVATLPASGSVESAPAVHGDAVYFSDTAGGTWCYGLDGVLRWEHHGAAPILAQPLVVDGRVFVTAVDDLGVGLDAQTGALLWRYAHKGDVGRVAELALYAAPDPTPVGDDVLMGFSDGTIVAIDQATGDLEWARRVGEGRYADLVAAPAVLARDIFVSGYLQPLVALDVETRAVRWRADVGAAGTPLAIDLDGVGMLFHPGVDGVLRAYVALTGAEKWRWDSGSGGALTAPVATEAGLLVGSADGSLHLVDEDTGAELWSYDRDHQLNGVSAAPTVAGRQLLFTTNAGRLYSMLAPVALQVLEARTPPGPEW